MGNTFSNPNKAFAVKNNNLCFNNPFLIYIDLAYNRLSNLHQYSFSCVIKIEKIDLSYNKLTYLSIGTFKECIYLSVLLLQGNEMMEFRVEHNIGLQNFIQLRCLRLDDNKLTNADFLNSIKPDIAIILNVNLAKNNIDKLSNMNIFTNRSKQDIFQPLCSCEERSGYVRKISGRKNLNINLLYTMINCIFRFRNIKSNQCPGDKINCSLHSYTVIEDRCRRHGIG